jgi:hypothetical protein
MIAGLAPGTYTVTVTDMNGCTSTGTGQVDAFGCSLDAILPDDMVICDGDTALITSTVNGASGSVSYLWSNGATTPSIEVSATGEYCVTVTDEAGCQDIDCIFIMVLVIPDFDCPVTNESAPDQNDGAIGCDTIPGVISYLWSNGATTPMISGLAPGVYCLTITDAQGCTKEECFIVQPGNCQLVITSVQSDVLCAGDNNGMISVTVENATPPVAYLWSNAETTSSIGNLGPGDYSVTITDAAGCTEIRSYTITEPPALTITVDSVQDISAIPGMILITVAGGVPPYGYLWTDPLGGTNTSEDQNFLTISGTYSVMVTDANGCTVSNDSINVDVIDAVHPDLKPQAVKVYPVPVANTLYIDFDASIQQLYIVGIDGRTVLQERDMQDHTLDLTGLEAGWYLLRFTDGEHWYYAKVVK